MEEEEEDADLVVFLRQQKRIKVSQQEVHIRGFLHYLESLRSHHTHHHSNKIDCFSFSQPRCRCEFILRRAASCVSGKSAG